MEKRQEVWRKMDGKAIRCTECVMNSGHVLTNETPVGINYTCDAPDGICIFMHMKPDNDRWYASDKDIFQEETQEANT